MNERSLAARALPIAALAPRPRMGLPVRVSALCRAAAARAGGSHHFTDHAVERRLIDEAARHLHDFSFAIDQDRRGQLVHVVTPLREAALVHDDRVRQVLGARVAKRSGVVVVMYVHAHDHQPPVLVAARDAVEDRRLHGAGAAPRRPEIEQDEAAPEVLQRELRALLAVMDDGQNEGGGRLGE